MTASLLINSYASFKERLTTDFINSDPFPHQFAEWVKTPALLTDLITSSENDVLNAVFSHAEVNEKVRELLGGNEEIVIFILSLPVSKINTVATALFKAKHQFLRIDGNILNTQLDKSPAKEQLMKNWWSLFAVLSVLEPAFVRRLPQPLQPQTWRQLLPALLAIKNKVVRHELFQWVNSINMPVSVDEISLTFQHKGEEVICEYFAFLSKSAVQKTWSMAEVLRILSVLPVKAKHNFLNAVSWSSLLAEQHTVLTILQALQKSDPCDQRVIDSAIHALSLQNVAFQFSSLAEVESILDLIAAGDMISCAGLLAQIANDHHDYLAHLIKKKPHLKTLLEKALIHLPLQSNPSGLLQLIDIKTVWPKLSSIFQKQKVLIERPELLFETDMLSDTELSSIVTQSTEHQLHHYLVLLSAIARGHQVITNTYHLTDCLYKIKADDIVKIPDSLRVKGYQQRVANIVRLQKDVPQINLLHWALGKPINTLDDLLEINKNPSERELLYLTIRYHGYDWRKKYVNVSEDTLLQCLNQLDADSHDDLLTNIDWLKLSESMASLLNFAQQACKASTNPEIMSCLVDKLNYSTKDDSIWPKQWVLEIPQLLSLLNHSQQHRAKPFSLCFWRKPSYPTDGGTRLLCKLNSANKETLNQSFKKLSATEFNRLFEFSSEALKLQLLKIQPQRVTEYWPSLTATSQVNLIVSHPKLMSSLDDSTLNHFLHDKSVESELRNKLALTIFVAKKSKEFFALYHDQILKATLSMSRFSTPDINYWRAHCDNEIWTMLIENIDAKEKNYHIDTNTRFKWLVALSTSMGVLATTLFLIVTIPLALLPPIGAAIGIAIVLGILTSFTVAVLSMGYDQYKDNKFAEDYRDPYTLRQLITQMKELPAPGQVLSILDSENGLDEEQLCLLIDDETRYAI